jgi:Protein of unknown function (DUF1275)
VLAPGYRGCHAPARPWRANRWSSAIIAGCARMGCAGPRRRRVAQGRRDPRRRGTTRRCTCEDATIVTDPGTVSSSIQGRALAVRGLSRALVDEQNGPLPALLLALTVLAGVVDATSILRLGHVFVATMTGNLVFIGLAAAGAKGFAVSTSALALGGFVVGVLIGGRVCRAARSHRGLALRNVLVVKLWLASAITLVAVLTGPRFPIGVRDTMLVLLAISMGAQLAAIRYLKVPDLRVPRTLKEGSM